MSGDGRVADSGERGYIGGSIVEEDLCLGDAQRVGLAWG